LIVGGAFLSTTACTVKTASTAPRRRRWPVAPFVEDTASFFGDALHAERA
jgi:hypothetical protein